ncbi:EamA family transporter RarD [Acinetobacter rathckeae]|uniref:EamA family transporter RarD n=1 Tax=Acinetobacter rathckeae TaxID=2605272 RepID=UPI0018A259AF|nr:EamA family transporter RarD [Acinetobacter rathckeae]MBF7687233.1 EamA family transporter RarD [Acinetobacter rathckeae]
MVKGIVFSVLASSMFGVLYFYTQLLNLFDGSQAFGWRMISLLPFLTLFMCFTKDIQRIKEVALRVRRDPKLILGLMLTAALGGLQLWLFLWAPMHGRGMQVSLGYFLLPLVLVLVGSIAYQEKVSCLQKTAALFALVGVVIQIWQVGSIAWETILVAVGYSAYFFVRKAIQTDHLGGFWFDNVLVLPVAFYFVSTWAQPWHTFIDQPQLFLVIAGLGILSALGLGSYILASRYLSMVLFGLLSYLEPVLLALASLAIGERLTTAQIWGYAPIWLAVVILIIEGVLHLYKKHQQHKLWLNKIEKSAEKT